MIGQEPSVLIRLDQERIVLNHIRETLTSILHALELLQDVIVRLDLGRNRDVRAVIHEALPSIGGEVVVA